MGRKKGSGWLPKPCQMGALLPSRRDWAGARAGTLPSGLLPSLPRVCGKGSDKAPRRPVLLINPLPETPATRSKGIIRDKIQVSREQPKARKKIPETQFNDGRILKWDPPLSLV